MEQISKQIGFGCLDHRIFIYIFTIENTIYSTHCSIPVLFSLFLVIGIAPFLRYIFWQRFAENKKEG